MSNVVFDASALLALIQQEQGAEIIKPLLKFSVMSTINVAECLTTLIPFDLGQARNAAELQSKVQHKGLSLGDRACIALGIKLQAPIYTADRIWAELKLDGADIKLIR